MALSWERFCFYFAYVKNVAPLCLKRQWEHLFAAAYAGSIKAVVLLLRALGSMGQCSVYLSWMSIGESHDREKE
jgi:hypothetical protein